MLEAIVAIKQVYKSKDFDKYLDGKRLTANGKRALFKVASRDNTLARREYVPVATGATQRSMRMNTLRGGADIELSSLNYGDVGGSGLSRYEYTKSNSSYKIRGKKIPAGKNAGKYQWYDKAHADNAGQSSNDMKGAIHD